jgi:hypothetical protein
LRPAPITGAGLKGGWPLCSGAPRHVVEADVLVFFEAFCASFASEAWLLDASEGGAGVGRYALVDAHDSGFEAVRDVEGAVKVFGEDVAGEAEFCCVGPGDRFVFWAEPLDRGDGTENLGLGNVGIFGDAVKDGRGEEVACRVVSVAAVCFPRPFPTATWARRSVSADTKSSAITAVMNRVRSWSLMMNGGLTWIVLPRRERAMYPSSIRSSQSC